MSNSTVRVRFAPSPTGYLHIGGLRTALYNYLFAKKFGGDFLLRIEDTDQGRYVPEAEADIITSLQWAGLTFDEGPGIGGDCAPYYQSQRSELYQKYALQLIEAGQAYYAFDTEEEIEAMRHALTTPENPQPKYDFSTRIQMRNSLTMSPDEVQSRIDAGEAYVIRLLVPENQDVTFHDAIRGEITFNTAQVDDQVLMKSDGLPTYHLANVVDDYSMRITHVIRGEEWLPSTPKHVLLYQCFGWQAPQFAHLSLILSPNGGKLSKRNADKMGIPVSVKDYITAGYEPEALLNFLALLGWHPDGEHEIFSLSELVEAFSLDNMALSGAQFSMDKLKWFNEHYIRAQSPEQIAAKALPFAPTYLAQTDVAYLTQVANLMRERITFAEDIFRNAPYFFHDPEHFEEKPLKKGWKEASTDLLYDFADIIERLDDFSATHLHDAFNHFIEVNEVGMGALMLPCRLALTGLGGGPGLFEIMEVLGKETTLRRLRNAPDKINHQRLEAL